MSPRWPLLNFQGRAPVVHLLVNVGVFKKKKKGKKKFSSFAGCKAALQSKVSSRLSMRSINSTQQREARTGAEGQDSSQSTERGTLRTWSAVLSDEQYLDIQYRQKEPNGRVLSIDACKRGGCNLVKMSANQHNLSISDTGEAAEQPKSGRRAKTIKYV